MKDIKYPTRTKIPSSSSKPKLTKNIDQLAARLVKGIGKGRARESPNKNINKPLRIFMVLCLHRKCNLGRINFLIFIIIWRDLLTIF